MNELRNISALRAILPASVEIALIKQEGAMALAKLAGRRVQVVWVGEGWLAQVKPVLDQLTSKYPSIFVARKMSLGAQEFLRDHQINWVDETGAANIVVGTLIVARSGHPLSESRKTQRWTPAVLGVAEALLCHRRATVSAMEEITGLSTGSCTNALRFLVEQGHLTSPQARGRESARAIADFNRLLEDYSSHASLLPTKASLNLGVFWKDPAKELAKICKKWTQEKLKCAVTGELASYVLAPILTQVSTYEVYLNATTIAELEAAARLIDLRPIAGGRLILKTTSSKISDNLTIKKEGLVFAPWPRIYTDLRQTGVRGEEAAEHLKEVMLGR